MSEQSADPTSDPTPLLRSIANAMRGREQSINNARARIAVDQITFGREARRVRTSLGLSLTEVAKTCNVSKSFLSDIERGRRSSDRVATELIKLYSLDSPDNGAHHGTR